MGRQIEQLRRNAELLRADSLGVATENKPRKLQARTQQNGFRCSLNVSWLDQIGMANDKEPTLHSMTLGVKPVIVQNPAIIIQPKDVIEGE